ncbi:MAG TPA: CDP-alcohol phosphatidyltransferase family protein [Burkholderiales bacterium]|nr:CDP-alcohol phosphatidyltransferase family protein [Burkholderiales bacterium]
MTSTYQLKSRFQSLLRPLAAHLYRAGVTANQITIGACLISVALGAAALAFPQRHYLFLFIALWCLLRMAANALDGVLAREFGQASRLGAVLNELGDVISDVALYLPFAWVAGSQPWLVIAVVLLALCSEFAGLLGPLLNNARGYDGPMGKSDRAVVFGLAALLIGSGISVAPFINLLWASTAALLVLTIIHRARSACTGHRGNP